MKMILITERINHILSDILDFHNDIRLDYELDKDMGADSLDMVEILTELEKEFNININLDNILDITTVGDLVKLVNDTLTKNGHTCSDKDELECTSQQEIDTYVSLYSKFSNIAREIFMYTKVNTNVMKSPGSYKGFYFTQENLVIIYTSTKNDNERNELKINVNHLINETWKKYIDDIGKKTWLSLDNETRNHLKSKYVHMKSMIDSDKSDYWRGQMELMESIYGKNNLI